MCQSQAFYSSSVCATGVADGRSGLQPRKIEGLCKKEACQFAFGSGPHVLALTSKGKMFSWGHNGYCQLGLGSTNQGIHPAPVTAGLGESRIVQVACGSHHSLALSSEGEVGTEQPTQLCTHVHTHAHTHTRTHTHTHTLLVPCLSCPSAWWRCALREEGDRISCC